MRLYKKYIYNAPTSSKEQLQHCNNFNKELDKLVPNFDVDKLDTLPFPRLVKQIKEYDQDWLNLLEEFENNAPFHIIHDI